MPTRHRRLVGKLALDRPQDPLSVIRGERPKALGLTITPSLVARADEVIE